MKFVKIVSFLVVMLVYNTVDAQEVLSIWKDKKIPFHKENDLEEYEKPMFGTKCVFNITEPTLTIYRPEGQITKRAVIILPGGGYEFEAAYHEGYEVAEFLSSKGITAAVLKYRLPNPASSDTPEKVPIADLHR